MGQFNHPNVVKLYGVVTVGEPVSLIHMKPTLFLVTSLQTIYSLKVNAMITGHVLWEC